MAKVPDLWLVMNGPPVPPFAVFTEEEAQTRANAGQMVWKITQMERVLKTSEQWAMDAGGDTDG